MDKINECAAGNLLTRVATSSAVLHICLNGCEFCVVSGFSCLYSPSVTGVSLMITLFCRSLLSLFAYKICIDSSVGKPYKLQVSKDRNRVLITVQ